MNYINLSESVNIDSDIGSIGTESIATVNNNQSGGFLSSLFGSSNDINDIALSACKKGEFAVVSFLIRENKLDDYEIQEAGTGYTILHYVVAYYKQIPRADEVLDKLLRHPDVSNFINIQDYVGKNTALHIAVKTRNHMVADKLIKAGADVKIQNSEHLFVGSDTESDDKDILRDIHIASVTKPDSVFIKKSSASASQSPRDVDTEIVDLVKIFMKPRSTSPATSDASINMTDLNTAKTAQSVQSSASPTNTTDFVDQLIMNYGDKPVAAQAGGRKNVSGTRTMNTLSDYNLSGGVSSESELSRLVKNQSSEIHERTEKKIAEIMNVDIDTAKAYKAWIYQKVKQEHPDLNNFDRAVEMEKMATKDILKSVDIKKVKQEIADKRAAKASSSPSSEEKPRKPKQSSPSSETPKKKKGKGKKDESATSSASIPSESRYSATSTDF